MSEAYICRRGGGGKKAKVAGGTTQPTGAENLIWVNTSAAITSAVFKVTEPASPSEGMVWIRTSTASTAPIEVNGIWVYPTGCRQYISGAWVDKMAKTYQGGVWVDWTRYIYVSGSGFLPGLDLSQGSADTTYTVSQINCGKNTGVGGLFTVSPTIDLSSFSSLKMEIQGVSRYNATYVARMGVSSVEASGILDIGASENAWLNYVDVPFTNSAQVIALDISSIKQSAYIRLNSRAVMCKIYNIYLEV